MFFFLPIVLVGYFALLRLCSGKTFALNLYLLASSLVFYFWNENLFIFILLLSGLVDFFCGLAIDKIRSSSGDVKKLSLLFILWISVATNLGILCWFKYFDFFWDSLGPIVGELMPSISGTVVHDIVLPLGISFYTFQSMSYTIDVYRGKISSTKNPFNFLCYVALFPQLIAGPIVRYSEIRGQFDQRTSGVDQVSDGLRRFTIGLSKKILIADTLGTVADIAFSSNFSELSTPLAWTGLLCFTLQIYFDFSGYSDMAIGLGRVFGFKFPENFNDPYAALSLRQFWRRWHMTLSNWFRDYLYIPLGGNRKGSLITGANLIVVFFLCGLWHGASWNFILWGLWHGLFLYVDRTGFGKLMEKVPVVIRLVYVLSIVGFGWILFRTSSVEETIRFSKILGGLNDNISGISLRYYLTNEILLAMTAGVLICVPVVRNFCSRIQLKNTHIGDVATCSLLIISLVVMSAHDHRPFIYFKF